MFILLNITKSIISEAVLIASFQPRFPRYDATRTYYKKLRSFAILPYIYQCDFDLTFRKVHNSSNVGRVDIKTILQTI